MEFIYYPNKITLEGEDGKLLGEVCFPIIDADTVNIDHTFVDDSLKGQGIAGELTKAAAVQLRKQNKKAVLTCPYAVKWFEKHPEYSDLVKR